MKVLVTGGGGFLGSHIVRALLDRGDEVRVLGRSAYPKLDAWGVKTIRGDVQNLEDVVKAVDGVESVFHVASRVGYWGAHSDFVSTNVGGTTNVIEASKRAGVRRLVYTSTPSVVIGADGVKSGGDESLPYPKRYLSSYGPTKAEAERAVLAANGELLTVAIRPHFIFGPGDPQIAPRLVENRRRGTLAQVGDGTNRVDVTYIDNCVLAHLLAHDALERAAKAPAGKAYFIGQREPVSLWDFANRVLVGLGEKPVEKTIGFKAAYAIGAVLEGAYRISRSAKEPPLTRMAAVILGTSHYFDHSAAHRDFGYVPEVGTDEGLERLFLASRTKGGG